MKPAPSQTSEQAVLQLAHQRQLLRARDLLECGLPTITLTRLVSAGKLERIARGVYSLPNQSISEHRSLAEAAIRVPRGVVCLLSALPTMDWNVCCTDCRFLSTSKIFCSRVRCYSCFGMTFRIVLRVMSICWALVQTTSARWKTSSVACAKLSSMTVLNLILGRSKALKFARRRDTEVCGSIWSQGWMALASLYKLMSALETQ